MTIDHMSLIEAAKIGNTSALEERIEELTNEGIHVDSELDNRNEVGGNTALLIACATGSVPCVELLLSRGANINHTSRIGWNALICASQAGNANVVQVLLDKFASVEDAAHFMNQKDVYGNTALHWACFNANYATVDCLLKHGADITTRNHFGQMPEQCVGRDPNHRTLSHADKLRCLQLLQEKSSSNQADITRRNQPKSIQ